MKHYAQCCPNTTSTLCPCASPWRRSACPRPRESKNSPARRKTPAGHRRLRHRVKAYPASSPQHLHIPNGRKDCRLSLELRPSGLPPRASSITFTQKTKPFLVTFCGRYGSSSSSALTWSSIKARLPKKGDQILCGFTSSSLHSSVSNLAADHPTAHPSKTSFPTPPPSCCLTKRTTFRSWWCKRELSSASTFATRRRQRA